MFPARFDLALAGPAWLKGDCLTMATPREIVRAALTFHRPERIPRDLWLLPWAETHYPGEIAALRTRFPGDFSSPSPPYRPSSVARGDPYVAGSFTDEWGCRFVNIHTGLYGEVKEPILADLADRPLIRPPYEMLPADVRSAKDCVNRFCENNDTFVRAPCATRVWERYQFLRGTENAMIDVMTADAGTTELLRVIHEFNLKELAFWVTTDIDAIGIFDDWGSQTALLIPPAVWRSLFQPLYREYCELAHAHGKFVFLHSDGCITEIYPELVEIGVDALNSQLACMDLGELARIAKGRMTFWGEVDRQHILCAEDPDIARREVRRIAEALYDPAGGIIAQLEFGAGAKPATVAAVFEEWERVVADGWPCLAS